MLSWFKKQLSPGRTPPVTPGADDRSIAQEQVAGASYQERGNAFLKEGKWDDAARCFRDAIALNPQDAEAHYKLGDVLYERRMLPEAEGSYRRALESKPDFTEAQINLGLTLDEQGRFAEAEACYRQVIAYNPDHALAHFNLGVTLNSQARLTEAEACYRRTAELKPGFSHAHFNLGVVLQRQQRLVEAESSYRRTLEINPKYVDAHVNLGSILREQGKLPQAAASLGRALEIKPDYAEAREALLSIIVAQGQFSEAETIYQQTLARMPNDAVAHYNLGVSLKAQNRLAEAEACYRQALEIKPDFPEAHNNLGALLKEQGRLSAAEACYRRALAEKSDYAEAYCNLGILRSEQARYAEAEANYRRALEIKPDFADVHNLLGNTLKLMNRLTEAEASFRFALRIKPDFAEAYNNLGVIFDDQGRTSEAEASYRRALELKPDYSEAHGNLLFVLNYHPDLSGAEIFSAYRDYDEQFARVHRAEWREFGNIREPNRRLKIGYVSPDFRRHAALHFLEPLLAHHDKRVVEVYAYAELIQEDAATARCKAYVEHWIPTGGLSDAALAERIRADGIDILVDLAGHTGGNRLQVFARKPAPVSVSWLGYGSTTGLTAIDYFLTDETSAPLGSEALFSEQPWRLATPSYVYRPGAGMGPVSTLPATGRGYVTFGTLTRAVRINHRTIRCWSAILQRIEDARLVIDSGNFRDASLQHALAEKFAAHGIKRTRLEIGFHSPPWDVLRGIDIGLDCFPHNSGTTLFETLYMGIPYVTLAG
ncbi:MAG: tetratricopeptide repeat protein, partial [Betaproteobacteria bacterium]|nr:tetratricopeptide repeat protein [Betaproteobacteria bacterium]